MRWLAAIVLLLGMETRGDYVARCWVEPQRQEWTGDHWEWFRQSYFLLVHISSTGQERFELWEVSPETFYEVTRVVEEQCED